jgi:AcrR family transcriptional regulator
MAAVTSTKRSSRDRLLDAAATLFYRDGVHVGVHALCEAAGVSKRSMYQLFPTKDDLVAATLEHRGPRYQALFLPREDDERGPRERMLHVFHRLEDLSGTDAYRGCPFVSTVLELKDFSHPANDVARRFKQQLTDFFEQQADLAGARDAPTLAKQLTILFDGASARATMYRESLSGLCVTAAAALLDAAGVA